MNHRHTELGSETGEITPEPRHLESLDDIPREIADRRLHAEFGEHLDPEKARKLQEAPDHLETPKEFKESARMAGLLETESLLGWSTDLETPAHVRKGDVGREIATLIHEDLHRLTDPSTLEQARESAERRALYEGATEHLTLQAASGLHGLETGDCYPDETQVAREVAAEIREEALRDWYFRGELREELQEALERLDRPPSES